MRTAVLACPTIRDELTKAEEKVGSGFDFHYLDKSLHNFPDRLRVQIQSKLDVLSGYNRVLLAFGFCGNAVAGLRAGDYEMILPRVDDCTAMLFGSVEGRERAMEGHRDIFMTRGWIDGGAWEEYEETMKRHSPEVADEAFRLMYSAYDRLDIVDTRAYDLDEVMERAEILSRAFHLELVVKQGGVGYFERFLTGPWDDQGLYIRVPPHGVLDESQLTLELH
ncbi:MAG: DUF1638 domain-containing protein [Coriobacteriales bacterium]|jgi:hypothetical protein